MKEERIHSNNFDFRGRSLYHSYLAGPAESQGEILVEQAAVTIPVEGNLGSRVDVRGEASGILVGQVVGKVEIAAGAPAPTDGAVDILEGHHLKGLLHEVIEDSVVGGAAEGRKSGPEGIYRGRIR